MLFIKIFLNRHSSTIFSKKTYKDKGFTLLELLLVIVILSILAAGAILLINPQYQIAKGRDTRRLSDISILSEAVEEYKLDTGLYPDLPNTIRKSNTSINGYIYKSTGGWINQNLSKYLEKMHADPINNDTYFYRYMHNTIDYELDAKLEVLTKKAKNDNGNNINTFEMGTNLEIL